jgi:predicted dehydrogenase
MLPTHRHKTVASCALRRGKHVLCEKPMALTAGGCDQILGAHCGWSAKQRQRLIDMRNRRFRDQGAVRSPSSASPSIR